MKFQNNLLAIYSFILWLTFSQTVGRRFRIDPKKSCIVCYKQNLLIVICAGGRILSLLVSRSRMQKRSTYLAPNFRFWQMHIRLIVDFRFTTRKHEQQTQRTDHNAPTSNGGSKIRGSDAKIMKGPHQNLCLGTPNFWIQVALRNVKLTYIA